MQRRLHHRVTHSNWPPVGLELELSIASYTHTTLNYHRDIETDKITAATRSADKDKGQDQEQNGGSPSQQEQASTGDKRKVEGGSSPAPKARKTTANGDKDQKTLEETIQRKDMVVKEKDEDGSGQEEKMEQKQDEDIAMKDGDAQSEEQASPQKGTSTTKAKPSTGNGDSAVEPGARKNETPSNILEKGIVYFFFRGRVGIDEPQAVDDIARSYIILRPIDKDAKLGEGPIGDAGNSRLCAIPKKVLPQSGRDRWIAFVEKSGVSFKTLKDEFLASNDYVTKTAGTRHSPAATPIGEGVYAITNTGRENHLVYFLTLPEKLGETQTEIGLKQKGSFIISTRNPQYPPPKNAQVPGDPEFPKEVLDEFRSLRWMGTLPKHLDIVGTQFLLIGESSGIQKATQPDKSDQKDEDKETPVEELEKLEDEDTKRMEHLGKDDSAAIFADLEVQAKDYPKLQTTF